MMAAAVPTVYVIEDDGGMHQAVQDLVESVGLLAEAFANRRGVSQTTTHRRS